MAKLVFGMNQSLDGYVDHMAFAPSPTLFRHFIEEAQGQAGSVYGRQMYEVMRYWDDDHPEWDAEEHAFAAAWRNQPKWVVSRSLKSVGPNARLVQVDGSLCRNLSASSWGPQQLCHRRSFVCSRPCASTTSGHNCPIRSGSRCLAARVPRLSFPPLRAVRISPSMFSQGIERHRLEGHAVRVYSLARTVADCFRFRNTIGLDVALEALKEAWRSGRLNLDELHRVAKQLRVNRVMQPYLETIVL